MLRKSGHPARRTLAAAVELKIYTNVKTMKCVSALPLRDFVMSTNGQLRLCGIKTSLVDGS